MKRRIIIREYDFKKVKDLALTPQLYMLSGSLYDRAEFQPLTRDLIEKEYLIQAIKYPDRRNRFEPTKSVDLFLLNIRSYLYDNNYVNWNSWYGDDGYIYIQSRKNNPVSVLGWGTFEKDA